MPTVSAVTQFSYPISHTSFDQQSKRRGTNRNKKKPCLRILLKLLHRHIRLGLELDRGGDSPRPKMALVKRNVHFDWRFGTTGCESSDTRWKHDEMKVQSLPWWILYVNRTIALVAINALKATRQPISSMVGDHIRIHAIVCEGIKIIRNPFPRQASERPRAYYCK